MKSICNMWIYAFISACIFCAAVGTATAATISYVGVDYDIEDHTNTPTAGWHNATPVKPLDIDGDNILGTDGYEVYFTRRLQPAYLLPMSNVYSNRNNSSVLIDNTADPSGADVTAGFYHDATAGLGVMSYRLLQFVISGSDLDGKTLRVGVLVDVGSVGTATYTVAQTTGGSASKTSDTLATGGASLDVVYFDINDAVDGDTFVIKATTISGSALEQVVGVTFDTADTAASIALSNDTVSSNAAPGTLVGTLSDPSGIATSFVLTNAPAGGSDADNAKFQITDGTNFRTRVWMSQYSNNVSIAGISNGVALVTNSFPIYVTAATKVIFEVTAEVSSPVANDAVVGLMKVSNGSATFSFVGGRTDLFSTSGDNLVVANEGSWGGVGTTNHVTIRAVNGALTNELVVAASVVSGAASATLFLFR